MPTETDLIVLDGSTFFYTQENENVQVRGRSVDVP
jgi:hypothetical protein